MFMYIFYFIVTSFVCVCDRKYGLRIIVDLHAAPGSQNGWEHSGARDSSIEWAKTDDNINKTVRVIEFLTAR